MSGIMVGSALGGLGGWIAERQGWSHAFLVFGIVGIVYTFLSHSFCAISLQKKPRTVPRSPRRHAQRQNLGSAQELV